MKEYIKRLPIPPFARSIKIKAKNWLKRFLPAELTGTVTAVAAWYAAHYCTSNLVIAAYAGSVGETLGFYSTILIQDTRIKKRKLKAAGKPLLLADVVRIVRNILLDFGISELIDSFFLRPFCMYIFSLWLKNYPFGVVAGKFASDVGFYIPVVLSYEFRMYLAKRKQ